MTRLELLEAVSSKLTEAAILLLVGGEDRLATEVEEITERVDFSAHVQPLEAHGRPNSQASVCLFEAKRSHP